MLMYSVYDKKAETFNTPFFQKASVIAIRAVKQEVNRNDHANLLYTNPEDFELHQVGTFNEDTGELIANRLKIADLIDLKNKE